MFHVFRALRFWVLFDAKAQRIYASTHSHNPHFMAKREHVINIQFCGKPLKVNKQKNVHYWYHSTILTMTYEMNTWVSFFDLSNYAATMRDDLIL